MWTLFPYTDSVALYKLADSKSEVRGNRTSDHFLSLRPSIGNFTSPSLCFVYKWDGRTYLIKTLRMVFDTCQCSMNPSHYYYSRCVTIIDTLSGLVKTSGFLSSLSQLWYRKNTKVFQS